MVQGLGLYNAYLGIMWASAGVIWRLCRLQDIRVVGFCVQGLGFRPKVSACRVQGIACFGFKVHTRNPRPNKHGS